MFSPKVLYRLPCIDRTFITLFVSGMVVVMSPVGSWLDTMNCSLRTSYIGVKSELIMPKVEKKISYQNSNHRIMIRVIRVLWGPFDYL